jgi:hypothetical protein
MQPRSSTTERVASQPRPESQNQGMGTQAPPTTSVSPIGKVSTKESLLAGQTRIRSSDSLFQSMETSCFNTKGELANLIKWASPDNKGKISKPLNLANGLAYHFGTPTIKNNGDHWEVMVPVTGLTYRGLKVDSFLNIAPKENDFAGFEIGFDESLKEVKKVFANAKLKKGVEGNPRAEVQTRENGRPGLLCVLF